MAHDAAPAEARPTAFVRTDRPSVMAEAQHRPSRSDTALAPSLDGGQRLRRARALGHRVDRLGGSAVQRRPVAVSGRPGIYHDHRYGRDLQWVRGSTFTDLTTAPPIHVDYLAATDQYVLSDVRSIYWDPVGGGYFNRQRGNLYQAMDGSYAMFRGGQYQPVPRRAVDAPREGPRGRMVFGLDGKDRAAIVEALKAGYRDFDMAESYGNTQELAGILAGAQQLTRADLWLVYKFDIPSQVDDAGVGRAVQDHLEAVAERFEGYLDMVMIHNLHPRKVRIEAALEAMARLKAGGLIRAIGVSNLNPHDAVFYQLHKQAVEAPFDQIEAVENQASPLTENQAAKQLAAAKGLRYFGYSIMPNALLNDPKLAELAAQHRMSVAQLLILYNESTGATPVVSSRDPGRIAANHNTPRVPPEAFAEVATAIQAIVTERQAHVALTPLPAASTAVQQIGRVLPQCLDGQVNDPVRQQHAQALRDLLADRDFQAFEQTVVVPHADINANYHGVQIKTLLASYLNNPCDVPKKHVVLVNAARAYEMTTGRTALGSQIVQLPSNEVIVLD